jgi:hypothetical protein
MTDSSNALNWIVGGIVALLGIFGLFLASGAGDGAIYLFGLLLFGFAVLFAFSLIRRNVGRPPED